MLGKCVLCFAVDFKECAQQPFFVLLTYLLIRSVIPKMKSCPWAGGNSWSYRIHK